MNASNKEFIIALLARSVILVKFLFDQLLSKEFPFLVFPFFSDPFVQSDRLDHTNRPFVSLLQKVGKTGPGACSLYYQPSVSYCLLVVYSLLNFPKISRPK